MKRKTRVVISLFLTVIIVLTSVVIVSAEQIDVQQKISDRDFLYEIVTPVLKAKEQYYDIVEASVENVIVEENYEGGYDVDYILHTEKVLKCEKAIELPQIQGIANELGLNLANQSTETFIQELKSNSTRNNLITQKNRMSTEILSYLNNNAVLKERIIDDTCAELADFVAGIETEYIGQVLPGNDSIRAKFDSAGNFLKVQYGLIEGYTDDISVLLPDSFEEMELRGHQQVASTLESMIERVDNNTKIASESEIVSPMANNFTYYRSVAADYANTYTSSASSHKCGKLYHKDKSTLQDYTKYNQKYDWYCANDCANYVSQAMLAGGVPTSSTWEPGKTAWINCDDLAKYFTQTHNWWSTTNFANCNAGGIIAQYSKTDGDLTHVMMNVKNDTVERRFSAHTNDRYWQEYKDNDSIFGNKHYLVFYRFSVVYPAH